MHAHTHTLGALCHLREIVRPAVSVGGEAIRKQSVSLRPYLLLSSAVLSAAPFIASLRWIVAICPPITATLHTLDLRSKEQVNSVINMITLPGKSQNPLQTRGRFLSGFLRALCESWESDLMINSSLSLRRRMLKVRGLNGMTPALSADEC